MEHLYSFSVYLIKESSVNWDVRCWICSKDPSCCFGARHSEIAPTVMMYSIYKAQRRCERRNLGAFYLTYSKTKNKNNPWRRWVFTHHNKVKKWSQQQGRNPETGQKHTVGTSSSANGQTRTLWTKQLHSYELLCDRVKHIAWLFVIMENSELWPGVWGQEGLTWHFSTNVHTHSHTQPKAYIYAEILSKNTISSDHLCNGAKAKHLEFKNRVCLIIHRCSNYRKINPGVKRISWLLIK